MDHNTDIKKYQEKRIAVQILSESFRRIGMERQSLMLMECGTFLSFNVDDTGKKLLKGANFCRERLCPMCSWRRSLKIFGNTSRILDYIDLEQGKEIKYLFLTLTVKNVTGDELGKTFDMMGASWNRLRNNRAWTNRVKGAMRTLEVTYNKQDDTYHPHYHMILAVPKDYGKKGDKLYWDHDTWSEAWRKAARLDYNPVISIERVKGSRKKGIAEVSKYAVKSTDYIIEGNETKTDEVVDVLYRHLKGRRLVGYSGIFTKAQKALHLTDPEEGPLVDTLRGDISKAIIHYRWSSGLGCYQSIGSGTNVECASNYNLAEM